MKRHKMLSLDEDLFDRLAQEENASSLIESLLEAHYASKIDPNMIVAELSSLEAQKRAAEARLQEAQASKEAEQKKAAENFPKKKEIVSDPEHMKILMRGCLNDYQITEGDKEILFEEFYSLYSDKKVKNLMEWAEGKGLQKREKRCQAE